MWMLTLLVCIAENLRTYLQVPALVQEYIMFFCSCPLIWKSQLQTETALSTFHAEYVALCSAIRNSSPSNAFSRNLSTADTFPTQLLSSMTKIITQPTFLLQTTVSLSAPSTLMLSGSSFGNMWMKDM